MIDPPDDLADMLTPHRGEPPEFREALLRQTERRLARDRWLRRVARLSGVASLCAACGVAGWLARNPGVNTPGSPTPVVEVVAVPIVVPILQQNSEAPANSPALSASEVELRAEQEDNPSAAATLYRQAGDSFLRDQDYTNATRCYRLFLQRGGDAALSLETNDSWLLVSLKNAAYKERSDATKNDS